MVAVPEEAEQAGVSVCVGVNGRCMVASMSATPRRGTVTESRCHRVAKVVSAESWGVNATDMWSASALTIGGMVKKGLGSVTGEPDR